MLQIYYTCSSSWLTDFVGMYILCIAMFSVVHCSRFNTKVFCSLRYSTDGSNNKRKEAADAMFLKKSRKVCMLFCLHMWG